MALILAFDPGESTGLAAVDSGNWPPRVLQTATVRELGELVEWWKYWILPYHELRNGLEMGALVYESWRLRPGTAKQKVGSEFPEIQVIGAIKLLAYQAGLWDKLVKQEPYSQAGTMFDATLRQYGKSLKLKTPHEKSALCHALYYLKRRANRDLQMRPIP